MSSSHESYVPKVPTTRLRRSEEEKTPPVELIFSFLGVFFVIKSGELKHREMHLLDSRAAGSI